MRFLDQTAADWCVWMIAASWQITAVACVVALFVALLADFSPRLRYGLWLLVLLKVFLPPTIASPWSVGRWVIDPVKGRLPQSIVSESAFLSVPNASGSPDSIPAADADRILGTQTVLFVLWSIGALMFAVIVLWRYARVWAVVRNSPTIDEGPVRVAMESISLRLGLRDIPELHAIENTGSPFLLGLWQPRIAIPQTLLRELNSEEIHDVLTHELVHWQRRDPWIGWIQFIAQMLFWFHPLVWWANNQLRHQRECVCDEISLAEGQRDPKRYGETIVRVLTVARGRSPVAGGMIGVFEKGSKLQNRVEKIMNYEPTKRGFGWISRGLLCALALVLLPMAPSQSQDAENDAPRQQQTPYPVIVETIPEQGATDVDPKLDTITVKFDRDMEGGMSWTGGPPEMPPTDKSRKARWTDKRTCVLPVKLSEKKIYRVGINSKSFQNFRSADGKPAPPDVIAFATRGASEAMQEKIRTPAVAKLTPANGATEVDPSVKAIRVTFTLPMAEGMSWTGGGENFPEIPANQPAKWADSGTTCILPVKLKPNHSYRLGLNSLSHNNFQSKFGIPLNPVVYEFTTAGE